jgi:Spy/CpxP family protein refolding chaperone
MEKHMKKLTQVLALAGVAALCLSTANVFAQDSGGPGAPGGDQGGPGGGRGNRGPGGGRGGFGNFDPAQMQQMFNERIKTAFGSSDEEWKAIEPLVSKVNELRREQMSRGFRGAFGRGGRGGAPGGSPGQASPGGNEASNEETALNEAIEKNAPKEELKAKMAAYRKAKADKEAALKKAQDDLKKVLTTKQEATALQMGLVN